MDDHRDEAQRVDANRPGPAESGCSLRPVTILVPDVTRPGFRDELRRQIASLNAQDEKDTLDFIDALLKPDQDEAR